MNYNILDRIDSPNDLKKLEPTQLAELCSEIRSYIVECCSKNPGHIGSSLGAVELIVGLHYIYNTPEDKIIFDVSHQAYAHKILTGRREAFKTLRRKDGLSGFTNRKESPYDAFGAGHSSTSISAALGFASAAVIKGSDEKVVALIGDGALSGGMALEALNNALDSDILVILNDNNISIDKNIGAIHNHLLRLTTSSKYNSFKRSVWDGLGEGRIRTFIQRMTHNTKSAMVKQSGGDLFEAMGFRYFGPIDGNNIEQVTQTLQKLRNMKGPKLLHAITTKGKGYAPAEKNQTVWHAPGLFDPESGERIVSKTGISRYQDVFGDVLIDLAKENDKIVGVTPAMASGCGMLKFSKVMPDKFFDVGIAEEHAVTFSAGLAAAGLKPFCNIYSSFSQRAYDQIIHDVALQSLPVVFCFDRAGLVGEDGATHHGAFDMAAYRSIPGIVISSPKDEIELKDLMYSASLDANGPYIIRYPRGYGEGVAWKEHKAQQIPTGKGECLTEGEEVAVLAIGPLASRANKVAQKIKAETGHSPAIYNMRFLKPIDVDLVEDIFARFNKIITIEDGCLKGGLYGEICEMAASRGISPKINGIGIPDRFIRHGNLAQLHEVCGMDEGAIAKNIKKMMQKTSK